MEKLNFVKNGVSKLPPGFRFQPTDEELVFQYLKCKVFSYPLPASIIPEINVCKHDPWDLPGNCDHQERYFFSPKEAKYRNGNRMNRTTKCGYWKATGSDKRISSSTCSGIVGIRKTLIFYEGKSPKGSRTQWILHEYRLASVEKTGANCNSSYNYVNEIGDWVLCRLWMKKRSVESDGSVSGEKHMHVESHPRLFDFMMVGNSNSNSNTHSCTSSSCSSSSNIMEVSSNASDHEETSAYAYF
ncbi:NAC domain-containing protein 83 [Cajanus cajan]|uniref:NAC domain-containing protein 68 n=1 Tax=Cajanus cajan TaxID=3821 RepID=A0A151RRF9_CAJCA|nr:NAC domain-containing protein 83 [Cajanus cajan]KYP45122.1 NAC domain-containing protein 68 [Cajanus cajan]